MRDWMNEEFGGWGEVVEQTVPASHLYRKKAYKLTPELREALAAEDSRIWGDAVRRYEARPPPEIWNAWDITESRKAVLRLNSLSGGRGIPVLALEMEGRTIQVSFGSPDGYAHASARVCLSIPHVAHLHHLGRLGRDLSREPHRSAEEGSFVDDIREILASPATILAEMSKYLVFKPPVPTREDVLMAEIERQHQSFNPRAAARYVSDVQHLDRKQWWVLVEQPRVFFHPAGLCYELEPTRVWYVLEVGRDGSFRDGAIVDGAPDRSRRFARAVEASADSRMVEDRARAYCIRLAWAAGMRAQAPAERVLPTLQGLSTSAVETLTEAAIYHVLGCFDVYGRPLDIRASIRTQARDAKIRIREEIPPAVAMAVAKRLLQIKAKHAASDAVATKDAWDDFLWMERYKRGAWAEELVTYWVEELWRQRRAAAAQRLP